METINALDMFSSPELGLVSILLDDIELDLSVLSFYSSENNIKLYIKLHPSLGKLLNICNTVKTVTFVYSGFRIKHYIDFFNFYCVDNLFTLDFLNSREEVLND